MADGDLAKTLSGKIMHKTIVGEDDQLGDLSTLAQPSEVGLAQSKDTNVLGCFGRQNAAGDTVTSLTIQPSM